MSLTEVDILANTHFNHKQILIEKEDLYAKN